MHLEIQGYGLPSGKPFLENEETFNLLRQIIFHFWETEVSPKEWEIGLLKILPKKGDLSLPVNYRASCFWKQQRSFTMHSCLQPIAKEVDLKSQCGFRPGLGCTDANFNVRMAMKIR